MVGILPLYWVFLRIAGDINLSRRPEVIDNEVRLFLEVVK